MIDYDVEFDMLLDSMDECEGIYLFFFSCHDWKI